MGNIKTQPSRFASRTLGDLQISGNLLVYGVGYNQLFGGTATRYVVSGEMSSGSGPGGSPGGADGNIQFNDAGSFGGEDALRWNKTADAFTISGATWLDGRTLLQGPVQVSGIVRAYDELRITNREDLQGAAFFPRGSAGGLSFYLYGSGYLQGSVTHFRLQNVPSRDQWVDLPVLFDAGVQVSGAPLVAYRPLFATNQSSGSRYVTSGEIAAVAGTPAAPIGSIQFNNAGAFGGDADLRWDTTAMLLTVSGAGLAVEAPAIFRAGAGVQISGAATVYDRLQVGRTNLNDLAVNVTSRGQVFGGHGADSTGWGWAINGSGVIRGHVQFVSLDSLVGAPFDHVSFGLPVVFHTRAPIQLSGNAGGNNLAMLTYRPIFASPQGTGTRYVTSGELSGSPFGTVQLSGTTLAYGGIYGGVVTGTARYITSGELTAAVATASGVTGDVQFNSGGLLAGNDRLRWASNTLRVSGLLTVENTTTLNASVVVANGRVEVGDTSSEQYQVLWGGSSTARDYELIGSGYVGGPVTFESRAGGSASEFVRFLLPVLIHGGTRSNLQSSGVLRQYGVAAFGNTASLAGTRISEQGDLQLSGNTVAYRPLFATHQTSAARYVTSGELGNVAAAGIDGSIQFNSGGVLGADDGLRWDGSARTATLSGVLIIGGEPGIRQQAFYGSVGDANGFGYTLAGSGTVRGAIQYQSRWANERVLYQIPILFHTVAPVQISGQVRAYNLQVFGDPASGGGTRITAQGDVQISGGLRIYNGAQMTGNLDLLNWNVVNANSVLATSAIIPTVATDNLFSSATTVINVGSNMLSSQGLQISGACVSYVPLYQRVVTGASRYITSGELPPSDVDMTEQSNAFTSTTPQWILVSGYTIPAATFSSAGGRVELEMFGTYRQRNNGSRTFGLLAFCDDVILYSGSPQTLIASGLDSAWYYQQVMTAIPGTNRQMSVSRLGVNAAAASGVQPGDAAGNALLNVPHCNPDLGFNASTTHWLKVVFVSTGPGSGPWSVIGNKLMARIARRT